MHYSYMMLRKGKTSHTVVRVEDESAMPSDVWELFASVLPTVTLLPDGTFRRANFSLGPDDDIYANPNGLFTQDESGKAVRIGE